MLLQQKNKTLIGLTITALILVLLMAFAAEEARMEQKVIRMETFRQQVEGTGKEGRP